MIFVSFILFAISSWSWIAMGFPRMQDFEEKIYSQNGEDGILLFLLGVIGIETKYYVEFGVEDGTECNSRILREMLNFTGLSMDGGNENSNIGLHKEFITERNILELFKKYDVPHRFDVLSLDVDMFDLWILIRLLRDGEYRPRIIIVETNPTLCVSNPKLRFEFSSCNEIPLTVNHPNMTTDPHYVWDLTRYSGANPKAFALIGKMFGYDMVYCEHCGVNCFLVQSSELPEGFNNNYMTKTKTTKTPNTNQLEDVSLSSNYIYKDNQDKRHNYDDIDIPFVAYPCFGTSASGGAHPGHVVDITLKRAAIHLTPIVLDKIKHDTLDAHVDLGLNSDIEEYDMNFYSCDVDNGEYWGYDWFQYDHTSYLGGIYENSTGIFYTYAQQHHLLLERTAIPMRSDDSPHPSYNMLANKLSQVPHSLCKSRHKSEFTCRLLSFIYYNSAIQYMKQHKKIFHQRYDYVLSHYDTSFLVERNDNLKSNPEKEMISSLNSEELRQQSELLFDASLSLSAYKHMKMSMYYCSASSSIEMMRNHDEYSNSNSFCNRNTKYILQFLRDFNKLLDKVDIITPREQEGEGRDIGIHQRKRMLFSSEIPILFNVNVVGGHDEAIEVAAIDSATQLINDMNNKHYGMTQTTEITIPVYGIDPETGVRVEQFPIIKFSAFDSIHQIVSSFCNNHIKLSSNKEEYDNVMGTCIMEIAKKVKDKANEMFLPGLPFPIQIQCNYENNNKHNDNSDIVNNKNLLQYSQYCHEMHYLAMNGMYSNDSIIEKFEGTILYHSKLMYENTHIHYDAYKSPYAYMVNHAIIYLFSEFVVHGHS